MIRVRYARGEGHLRVTLDGHALTAPRGQDIVCAAVSAVAQGLIMTLYAIAHQYPGTVDIVEESTPTP